MKITESEVLEKPASFKNEKGDTECVVFVVTVADVNPSTKKWKRGIKVADAKPGDIPKYTAIATFDENGEYPTDSKGKHAAIYLSHNEEYIHVLDQWNKQGEVKKRPIWFNKPQGTRRSNDGGTFYVIE